MQPVLPLGAQSLSDLLFRSAARHAGHPALGRRRGAGVVSISYAELDEQVRNFAAGLTLLGLRPGDRVALVSENWDRWLVADLAVLACGAVDVPRPSDLAPEEMGLTLHHAGCRFALAAGPDELRRLASLRARLPALETIIDLSDGSGPLPAGESFGAVCEAGRRARTAGRFPADFPAPAVRPDDLATLVYTSGTTGRPKGVMLTHGNILANVAALTEVIDIGPDDVMLSVLPSWHMYERTLEYAALSRGVHMVYTTLRALKEDLKTVRPTLFAGVPRLWSGMEQAVEARLGEERPIVRAVARLAWGAGRRAVAARRVLGGQPDPSSGRARPGRLAAAAEWAVCAPVSRALDPLVFRPVRRSLGGRLRGALSGGASLPGPIDLFCEVAGISLLNGYGLTETAPVLTCRRFDHNIAGTVGRPLPGTEIRIVDEEGREQPAGARGRIQARGPQVMRGYYRDPGLTAAVLDRNGWFDTGDLGRLLPSGDLVITGRAKDTIVLANGENVEPESLEERIKTSRYIDHAMLVGQDQAFLGVLVVPDFRELEAWARHRDLAFQSTEELVSLGPVRDLIREQIARATRGGAGGVAVRRFRLLSRPLSVEDGTLTPTLKVRRPVLAQRHAAEIRELFAPAAAPRRLAGVSSPVASGP